MVTGAIVVVDAELSTDGTVVPEPKLREQAASVSTMKSKTNAKRNICVFFTGNLLVFRYEVLRGRIPFVHPILYSITKNDAFVKR